MTKTGFITHCWKRRALSGLLLWACACAFIVLLGTGTSVARADAVTPEVAVLRLERSAESVALTANLNFELPSAVEEALLKGVPVIFVTEVEIFRDRWYWLDKRVAQAQRHLRLVFQPLTRRWRLTVSPGLTNGSGLGVALNQNFDTLGDALAAVRRVSGWRVVELAELDGSARHRLEFRFRLDAAQLPRPLQIGALGQSDWALNAASTLRFVPESLK